MFIDSKLALLEFGASRAEVDYESQQKENGLTTKPMRNPAAQRQVGSMKQHLAQQVSNILNPLHPLLLLAHHAKRTGAAPEVSNCSHQQTLTRGNHYSQKLLSLLHC